MTELLKHPIVHGALLGFWSAFVVDLTVFLKSTGWKVDGFSWSVATKRWFTGAVSGALGAAGLGVVLS
jgi:hypothetical protein